MSNSNKKRKVNPSSGSEDGADAIDDVTTDATAETDTPAETDDAAPARPTAKKSAARRPAAKRPAGARATSDDEPAPTRRPAKKTGSSTGTSSEGTSPARKTPAKKTAAKKTASSTAKTGEAKTGAAKAGATKSGAAKASTAKKTGSSAASKTSASKSSPAKSSAAKSTAKRSGSGGAVNVGGPKKNTGPKVGRKSGNSSSKAVANARKAASKSNNQVILWVIAAVVVVALAVVGVIAVIQRTDEANALPDGFPAGEVENGVLVYGDDDAPVVVDYWVDLLCPYCRQFETAAADTIEKAVASGDVKLQVHMVGLLDNNSNPAGYSTRAASAVLCAADSDKSYQLMKKLYEEQPAEGGPGLTNAELADFADDVGADDGVADCIDSSTNADLIAANSEQFTTNGYQGTPTVLVNGTELQSGADGLQDAIDSAKAAGPVQTTAPAESTGAATEPTSAATETTSAAETSGA